MQKYPEPIADAERLPDVAEVGMAAAAQVAMKNAHAALALIPKEVFALAQVFVDAGHQIALVGGPVRDAFLGLRPHDFDLTTSARPEQTEALLKEAGATTWDVGRAFGTIGGRLHDTVVEITTYRTDEYEVGSRKPQVADGDSASRYDLGRSAWGVGRVVGGDAAHASFC